jgi:MraZ protein
VFRGSIEHTVDDKGRVSIPKKFRDFLQSIKDERLVLTKFILHSVRCLDVYPQAAWERFENELVNKPRFDETFSRLETFYLSNAHECEVDKQGRILIPPDLREYARLTKEVIFAGAREKFRILNKETWRKFNEEAERDLEQSPHMFNSLNAS